MLPTGAAKHHAGGTAGGAGDAPNGQAGYRIIARTSRFNGRDGFSVNKGGSHARSNCHLRRVRFGSRNLVEYASCETV